VAFERDFSQQALFDIEIDGVTIAQFTKVVMPEIEVETVEYWDGKQKYAYKRPGNIKYGDLILTHGYAKDPTLQDWWTNIQKGVQDRKTVTLRVYDESGANTMSWNFYDTWPKKWKMTDFDGKANEVACEELHLNVEYAERA
jgi:phage tail-like protein